MVMNRQQIIIGFLRELAEHNEREWFQAHRDKYLIFKEATEGFALEFLGKMSVVDPALRGLNIGDITYRIYRDIRFSPDKSPYKTWFGAYLCPGGKKSAHAGYYIHFEPVEDVYFFCGGLYNPTPQSVRSIREEIMLNGAGFDAALKACKGFEPEWEQALRRVPSGYDKDDQYADYLRLRTYTVMERHSEKDFLRDDLIDVAVEHLSLVRPFNELLNRCVDYAEESVPAGGFPLKKW